jgi:hypothetical protein
VREVEMLKSPRSIKTHLPLQLLPEQLWTVRPKVNILVLTQAAPSPNETGFLTVTESHHLKKGPEAVSEMLLIVKMGR